MLEDITEENVLFYKTDFAKNKYLYFTPHPARPSVLNLIAQQKSDCNIVLIVAARADRLTQ